MARFAAFGLVLLAASTALAQEQGKPPAKLSLTLGFEELADAPATDKTKTALYFTARGGKEKQLASLVEGENNVELTGIPDGNHALYIKCPGYAAQYISVKLEDGQLDKDSATVTLYHLRYVTVRYAINMKGGRQLSGDGVESGRVALTHWSGPPGFFEDWQLEQRESGEGGGFGAVPVFSFHRHGSDFGFAAATGTFDEMTESPKSSETTYKCKSTEATEGLVLLCRVDGNSGNLGYGKIEVEKISLTPPEDPGIKVLKGRN